MSYVNSDGYSVRTGHSAWGSSMPKGTVEGVHSSSDLRIDDVAPGYFRGLQPLSEQEQMEARAKYPGYREAAMDTGRRATRVDHIISSARDGDRMRGNGVVLEFEQQEREQNPWDSPTGATYSRGGQTYSLTGTTSAAPAHEGSSGNVGNLDTEADRYCRAQIHQRRHEDAIQQAKEKNGGVMPDTYAPPKSEWWFQEKK